MKTKMLLVTTLTLALISSFSALAASRTAVAAPAVEVQTAVVKTLNLEQITGEVSPEMRLVLEEIQAQALVQAQADYDLKVSKGLRVASGKVAMQDFHFVVHNGRSSGTHIKEAKLTAYSVKALEGGGYEVQNPSSGERIKISLSISFKPLTATLTVEF